MEITDLNIHLLIKSPRKYLIVWAVPSFSSQANKKAALLRVDKDVLNCHINRRRKLNDDRQIVDVFTFAAFEKVIMINWPSSLLTHIDAGQ